jgi:hypothetical protein
VAANKALAEHKHPGGVEGASWDKEEKRVLSWSRDGTVRVWDVAANKALAEHKHPGLVWGASWDKEEKRVLSWSQDGTVRIVNLNVTPWIALPSGTAQADITLQVEARTGMRLDDTGALAPLSRQQWLQQKDKFTELQAAAPADSNLLRR